MLFHHLVTFGLGVLTGYSLGATWYAENTTARIVHGLSSFVFGLLLISWICQS